MLPAVTSTHKEQDIFHHDKNTNTTRPPTSPITIPLTASPSSPSPYKYSTTIRIRLLLDRRLPRWPFLLPLLPLLPPYTRNLVKGTSFVYNNGSFGLSFKNYTTLVSVALARVFNGLRQSCTSYQWQYGLFGTFIMRVFACCHQLGSCCSASCIKFILHLPFSLLPSLFFPCGTLL